MDDGKKLSEVVGININKSEVLGIKDVTGDTFWMALIFK